MELVIGKTNVSLTESFRGDENQILSAFCTGITLNMDDHIYVPSFASIVSLSAMQRDSFTFSAENDNFGVLLSVSPVNTDNISFSLERVQLTLPIRPLSL
jgi:hypothetical protein